MSSRVVALVLPLAMTTASCGDDALRPTAPQPTIVSRVAIATNPANAVSLFADVSTEHADSIRVRYESAADVSDTTPYYRADPSGTTRIAVHWPARVDDLLARRRGRRFGRSRFGDPQSATTGELPSTLQSLRLAGSGTPSAGYTLVVPLLPEYGRRDGFVVAFDEAGIVRWYHRFPGEWPVEAKQQPNGHITVFVGRTYGWQPNAGSYVELTAGGDVVGSYAVAGGSYTDSTSCSSASRDSLGDRGASDRVRHPVVRPDARRWIAGGAARGPHNRASRRHRRAHVPLERGISLLDRRLADPEPNVVDLEHPSSLAIAPDGGYVVSFQGMDEVTEIDSTTGAVKWRFGGRNNQFDIRDDPANGFLGQHDVQVLPNGNVLMFMIVFEARPVRPAPPNTASIRST